MQFDLLYFESHLGLQSGNVNEALDVYEVVLDVPADHDFFVFSVEFGLLGNHVRSFIPPGKRGWVGYSDLPEKGVDVLVESVGVNSHELVFICEF